MLTGLIVLMEKLFSKYLESAKNDVKKLRGLKKLFVEHQQFQLASRVRDIEQELHPISEQDEILQNEAMTFRIALSLFDLKVDEKIAFITFNAAKKIIDKNVEFGLKDASEIKALAEKLYD